MTVMSFCLNIISMVNGLGMTVVEEKCRCSRISYDKYFHEMTTLVSMDVNYRLLLAWHDQQFIYELSQNFPLCVSATVSY